MIGLDTNVVIRYLVQDDIIQSKKATKFIETYCTKEHPGYINCIVLCEIFWVLNTSYKYSFEEISVVIKYLLECPQIEIESIDSVWIAFNYYKKYRVDFSDALIAEINKSKSCHKTVTFDKGTAKLIHFSNL